MRFTFEFDEAKSRANKAKHGIDFVEAQALWLDRDLLSAVSRSVTEPRFLFVGKIDGKHWSAIVTYRGETIRIISVRRSRVREVEAYEARELDKKFDEGVEDVIDEFDLSTATRPNREQKRVNVDFPLWMVESLDREASRLGVTGSRSSRCGSRSASRRLADCQPGFKPPRLRSVGHPRGVGPVVVPLEPRHLERTRYCLGTCSKRPQLRAALRFRRL
jgi:uncharacterized DUF497 family protein